MKAYSRKKNLICIRTISQNFSIEKNSFKLEFISLITTGLESAEIFNCSCINITFINVTNNEANMFAWAIKMDKVC